MVRPWVPLLALAIASPAWAQEAIATAPHSPPALAAVPASAAPATIAEREAPADEGPVFPGPCGVAHFTGDGPPRSDRSPHGQVFAAVGSRGYREAGVAVCQPLGDRGALAVAVDVGRSGARR
jgi:hypothetical protein